MSQPRRLALICQHFYPEVASTGLLMSDLSRALTSLGWTIRAYCANPRAKGPSETGNASARDEWNGVSIQRIAPWGRHGEAVVPRLVFGLTYTLAVLLCLIRDRCSIDGILATDSPPFLGMAALAMRRLFGLRYCLIVYDIYPEIAVRLGMVREGSIIARAWSAVTRAILTNASAIVVIGRDMEAIVRARLGRCAVPVSIVPNWSDENTVRPVPAEDNRFRRQNAPQDRFVVQYSGTIGRTHNLELLVETARILAERGDIVFQFIGEGAKKQRLQSLAAAYRLRNVQFLPEQPVSRLAETLSAADLSIVSLDSAFTGYSVPSKTYGIMAAGVPILAILDGCSEIGRTVTEDDCGVVVIGKTPAEIAAVISTLAADSALSKRLGANGRRAFLSKYTLSSAAARYDAVLKAAFKTESSVRADDENPIGRKRVLSQP